MAHGPSCSVARGIFPDQGSNPCPLHWQADSQPLRHQGSPKRLNLKQENEGFRVPVPSPCVPRWWSPAPVASLHPCMTQSCHPGSLVYQGASEQDGRGWPQPPTPCNAPGASVVVKSSDFGARCPKYEERLCYLITATPYPLMPQFSHL